MMKRSGNGKEHSLRFLVIRAALVVAVVVAALLAFRYWGITVRELDVPAPVVEEIARDGAVPSAVEPPQESP